MSEAVVMLSGLATRIELDAESAVEANAHDVARGLYALAEVVRGRDAEDCPTWFAWPNDLGEVVQVAVIPF